MKWLSSLPVVETRIATGIALIAAVVIGLGPDQDRPFSVEKTIAVVLAAVAWCFAEFRDTRQPSANDIRLLQLIEENLNAGCLRFLRDHDFGTSFNGKERDGLGEITRWHGTQYVFLDAQLQKVWGPLQSDMSKFETLLAINSGPLPGKADLYSVFPGHHVDQERFDKLTDIAFQLNERASALVDRIDAFQLLARRRLKL